MVRAARTQKTSRLKVIGAVVIVVLIALIVAYQIAIRHAREQLIDALGPNAHWTSMDIGLARIVITGLAIDAEAGFPTDKEVTAERVTITPDVGSLVTRHPIVIREVAAENGSATLLRTKEGLRILPVLTHANQPKPADDSDEPHLLVQKMRFTNMAVDLYDQTVAVKDYKIHLEPAGGTLTGFRVPAQGSTLNLSFAAPVVSPSGAANGTFSISGTYQPHVGSDLQIMMQGVSIASLKPYAAKAGNTGIDAGAVDLNARSVVQQGNINANGVLTLHDVKIKTGGDAADTVLGLPRAAVIDHMKDKKGDIVLHFTLQGNEHDPKFSLNESLSKQLSAGLAEALGLPVDDLAKGVGSLGEQGLDAASHAASGVGDAVRGLFGGEKAESSSK
jgi:hypothetical protein